MLHEQTHVRENKHKSTQLVATIGTFLLLEGGQAQRDASHSDGRIARSSFNCRMQEAVQQVFQEHFVRFHALST